MPVLETGQRFKRYRVLSHLGSGLSGETYEAEDILRHSKVTLKLIHPWLSLPDAARRQFFRDMQDISALSHAYLAATFNYGEADGQLYIVRRYLEAGSLLGSTGRSSFRPPFPLNDAIMYTHQLSQVLSLIHSYGHTHGSLTLSNILILRGPLPQVAESAHKSNPAPFLLTDSGTAQFVRRYGQPQTTCLPITAAPEQLKGQIIAASDQYALAVLLYFWLTGRPPFLGSPDEIAQLKFSETFPLLSTFNPQVTLDLEGILRRALSADPDYRYPNILAFTKALLASFIHPAQVSAPLSNSEPVVGSLSLLEQLAQPSAVRGVNREAINEKKPETDPLPSPNPEITPQIEPPAPQPRPGSLPIPQPIPQPEPSEPEPPKREPASEPEILPPPAPDIAQPLPEPKKAPDAPASMVPLPAENSIATASFLINSGDMKEPREIYIEQMETTLGRAGSSDILLDGDTLTSRHHALLLRENQHYSIYDLRSTHGVTVNGHKLVSNRGQILEDGDYIEIGEYKITFRLQTSSAILQQNIEHALS